MAEGIKVKVKLAKVRVEATVALKEEVKPERVKTKFPTLRRSKSSDTIVLFASENAGTVIATGDPHRYAVGDYFPTWSSCNLHPWEKLPVGSKVLFTVKE